MSSEKRNERIKLLANNGMPPADIAAKYNLTESRIRQILDPRYNVKATASRRRRKTLKPLTPKETPSNGTHPSQATPKTHSGLAEQLPYIYGRLEVQLEVYAADLGCTFAELALGLSEILRDQARRKMVGASHRVPSVRRGTP